MKNIPRKLSLMIIFVLAIIASTSTFTLGIFAEDSNNNAEDFVPDGIIENIPDNMSNIMIIGDYAFDFNDPNHQFTVNNMIKAFQTAYWNDSTESFEYYYHNPAEGKWQDRVSGQFIEDEYIPLMNGDGMYRYWNMMSIQDAKLDLVKDALVQPVGDVQYEEPYFSVELEGLLPTDASRILWQGTDGYITTVPHSDTTRLYLNPTEEPEGIVNVYYLVEGIWYVVTATYADTGHLQKLNGEWIDFTGLYDLDETEVAAGTVTGQAQDWWVVSFDEIIPKDVEQILWQDATGRLVNNDHSGTTKLYLNMIESPDAEIKVYYLIEGTWHVLSATYADTGHLQKLNGEWIDLFIENALTTVNAAETEEAMEVALNAAELEIDFSVYDVLRGDNRQDNVLGYMLSQQPFESIADVQAHFEAEVAWQDAIDDFRYSAVAEAIDAQSFYDALIAMGDFQGTETQEDELFLQVKALLEAYLALDATEEAFVEQYIYDNAVTLYSREAILQAMQEGIEELAIALAGVESLELNREDNTILGPTQYNQAIEALPNYWLLDVYLHSSVELPEGTVLSLYFTGSDDPYGVLTVGEEGMTEGYLSELFGFPGRNTLNTRYHIDGFKELRLEIVLPKEVTLTDVDFTVTIQTSTDNFDELIFDLAKATLEGETFMGVLATVNAAETDETMWDALVALAEATDLDLERDFTNTGDEQFIIEMNYSIANFVLNNVSYKTDGVFASVEDVQNAVDDAHTWFGEIRTFVNASINGTLTRENFVAMDVALETMANAQDVDRETELEYQQVKYLITNSLIYIDTHEDNINLLNAALEEELAGDPNKHSRDAVLAALNVVLERLTTEALERTIDDATAYDYTDYNYKYDAISLDEAQLILSIDYLESVLRAYSIQETGDADDLYRGVMHDIARYLGALQRVEDSVVKSIVYDGIEYLWNDDAELKGSSWEDEHGTTLVSVIVADFMADPALNSIELILKDAAGYDVTLTLTFTVTFDVLNDYSVSAPETVTAGETFDITIDGLENIYGMLIPSRTFNVLIESDIEGVLYDDVLTSDDDLLGVLNKSLETAGTHELTIVVTQTRNYQIVSEITKNLSVTVEPAELHTLFINPDEDQEVIAGEDLQFEVLRGEDQFGNEVTLGDIVWTGTDAEGLFNETVTGEYTVFATVGQVESPEITVTVLPAPVDYFEVTGPTEIVAGATETYTITVYDEFDNVAVVAADTSFSLFTNQSPASLTGSVIILEGESYVEFTYRSTKVATHTIFVNISGLTNKTIVVEVVPDVVNNVTIEASATEITAGGSVTFTLIAKDEFGNVVDEDDFVGAIAWTEPVEDGVLSTTTAGTYTITATVDGVQSNEVTVTIEPDVVNNVTIEASATEITAGESVTFTLIAKDEFGNVVDEDDFDGAIAWTEPVEDGVLSTTTAGTYTITATVDGVESNEVIVTIEPDVADYIEISGPTYILAGTMSDDYTITVYDRFGNVTTLSEEATLLLTSDASGEREFSPSVIVMSEGTSTATFTYRSDETGSQQITAFVWSGEENLEEQEADFQIEVVSSFTTVTAEYTGDTTTNMTDGNNAELVGLDENNFTVTSTRRQLNPLHVGLNATDGTIRLYQGDTNGSALEIEIDSQYTIVEFKITFASTAGDTLIEYAGFSHVLTGHANTTVTYSGIDITSFKISNVHETNVQVHIESIEITYTTATNP